MLHVCNLSLVVDTLSNCYRAAPVVHRHCNCDAELVNKLLSVAAADYHADKGLRQNINHKKKKTFLTETGF